MNTKKILFIGAAIIATAVIIASTSFIGKRSIPKAQPIPPSAVRLNLTVTNQQSEIPELEGLDKKVRYYMRKWQFKGASLAITRNDSLVYAKGYGWADEENGVQMEPGHILRMASVSKLLTAVGIMVLQDQGMLSIKDTVFGPSGILNDSLFVGTIKDRNHHKITVEHLLRHQGGFHRDPLFSSRDVKHQLQLDHAPEKEDFYRLVLSRRLRFMPGSWQNYSNFGYLLLSEIIEKVSGMPYEKFMTEKVLIPAGCYDMHIAGSYYKDKYENEVRYYTHEGDGKFIEEYNDSGRIVERCYGGNNIPLLSGAGAWCGSSIEIARLVASIDGDPGVPDILSEEAIGQMTEYFDNETYSLGWNDTNPDKGWSRSGTLSGTCALVKRFPDGECWILITNTSTWKGPGQARYTNDLFRQCRELYSDKLPARNLFE
ncbi:MAG: beta-lactamase family protein [Bacteroidales bacterium]|nr:beta-lactamase family protein [Bacteroidales bacterium]